MPDDKNFFAGLFDFSFQQVLARRIVKLLYILGILGGGIYAVIYVVLGFQRSSADGLIALVSAILCLFAGLLIWRVLLELVLTILHISDGIDRATRSGN